MTVPVYGMIFPDNLTLLLHWYFCKTSVGNKQIPGYYLNLNKT